MSKSLGNYIGINENANDIYGKVMSIPDQLIERYFELVTDIHPDDLNLIKESLNRNKVNPMDVKMRLAGEITALYHGPIASQAAEEHFKTVFQRREVPKNMMEFAIPCSLIDNDGVDLVKLLVSVGFSSSNSEARRLISQGAVKLNGNRIYSSKITDFHNGDVVQAGKLKYMRIIIER